MTLNPDELEQLGRAVYDFGEAEDAARGAEEHGPWDECPPAMQDFCRRLGAHIAGTWDAMKARRTLDRPGPDFEYPVPANQTRKDVN